MPAITTHGFKRAEVMRELKKLVKACDVASMERVCYLVTELIASDMKEVARLMDVAMSEYATHRINSDAAHVISMSLAIDAMSRVPWGDVARIAPCVCEVFLITMMQPIKEKSKIAPILITSVDVVVDEEDASGTAGEVAKLISSRMSPACGVGKIFTALAGFVRNKDAKSAAGAVVLLLQPDIANVEDVTGSPPWFDGLDGRVMPSDPVVQLLWDMAVAIAKALGNGHAEYVAAMSKIFRCAYKPSKRVERTILIAYVFATLCKPAPRMSAPADRARDEEIIRKARQSIGIILEELDEMCQTASSSSAALAQTNVEVTKKKRGGNGNKKMDRTEGESTAMATKSAGVAREKSTDYLNFYTVKVSTSTEN